MANNNLRILKKNYYQYKQDIYTQIFSLFSALFTIKGLDDIPSSYYNRELFHNGRVGFCKDGDRIVCGEIVGITLDEYDEPLTFDIKNKLNFYTNKNKSVDSVIFYNTINHVNLYYIIDNVVGKIAKLDSLIDKRILQLSKPFLFTGNRTMVNAVNALFNDLMSEKVALYAEEELTKKLTVLDLKVPDDIQILLNERKELYFELYNMIGIDTPVVKGERLITAEAESNVSMSETYFQMLEESREKFISEMNDIFSLKLELIINKKVNFNKGGNINDKQTEPRETIN